MLLNFCLFYHVILCITGSLSKEPGMTEGKLFFLPYGGIGEDKIFPLFSSPGWSKN